VKAETKKRLLRYTMVLFAALALAQGLRVFQGSSRDVILVYTAPAGPLEVELRDADGDHLRRARFAAQAERQHSLQLPDGTYEARLQVNDHRQRVPFVVRDDGAVDIRWRAQTPR
jgi:hypothetical protein